MLKKRVDSEGDGWVGTEVSRSLNPTGPRVGRGWIRAERVAGAGVVWVSGRGRAQAVPGPRGRELPTGRPTMELLCLDAHGRVGARASRWQDLRAQDACRVSLAARRRPSPPCPTRRPEEPATDHSSTGRAAKGRGAGPGRAGPRASGEGPLQTGGKGLRRAGRRRRTAGAGAVEGVPGAARSGAEGRGSGSSRGGEGGGGRGEARGSQGGGAERGAEGGSRRSGGGKGGEGGRARDTGRRS